MDDWRRRGGFLVAVSPPLSDVAGHLGKFLLSNPSCKSRGITNCPTGLRPDMWPVLFIDAVAAV